MRTPMRETSLRPAADQPRAQGGLPRPPQRYDRFLEGAGARTRPIGLTYLRNVGSEAYLPKNLGTPHHPTIIQYPSKNLTHIVSVVQYPLVRYSQS